MKFKNKFIKFSLIILSIIFIMFISIFVYYKSNIDVSDKQSEKLNFILSDLDGQLPTNEFVDFFKYNPDSDKNNVLIEIPKDYVIKKILSEYSINNLLSEYDITIKRIGFISNKDNPYLIECTAEVSYKDLINTCINANILCEINDKQLDFKYYGLTIGNIPDSIYSKFIPYQIDDVIYSYDLSKIYEKIDSSRINNLNIDKETITFKYNLSDASNLFKGIIKDDYFSIVDKIVGDISPLIIEKVINDKELLKQILDIKQ